MHIVQYGKEYKEEKNDEIRFDFTQEERKLCPKCNTALLIPTKICPNCGYLFDIKENKKE